MKLLIAILLSLPSLVLAAPFGNPAKLAGTEYLFRGAQPLGNIETLKTYQISEVIIFKNDTRGEVVKEIAQLKEAGYSDSQIHHIPMRWKEIDLLEACQQTISALQLLVRAERHGRRTYFHCTAGEDRTGMIAALSRMLLARQSTEQMFADEMCANGYSDGNPNKPAPATQAIEQGLTPLFFALAEKIESGDLNSENLMPEMCSRLEVKSILRRCK